MNSNEIILIKMNKRSRNKGANQGKVVGYLTHRTFLTVCIYPYHITRTKDISDPTTCEGTHKQWRGMQQHNMYADCLCSVKQ